MFALCKEELFKLTTYRNGAQHAYIVMSTLSYKPKFMVLGPKSYLW